MEDGLAAPETIKEAPGQGVVNLLRDVSVGGLAGLVAGFIVAGVGGRIVMRLTALVAPVEAIGRRTEGGNIVGTVTFDGTVELLLFVGLGSGVLGGLLLVMIWPWISAWGSWRSIALGGFVLAVASTEAVDPRNFDFVILGNQLFSVLLFWSLFFAWGFIAVWLHGVFDRRFPAGSQRSTIVYGVIAALGLPSLVLLPQTLFGEFSNIPLGAGISVMVLGVATLGLWTLRFRQINGRRVAQAVRTVGYAAFTLTLVIGATRAVSDAVEVIT
jgi:hypothetical protein